MAPATIVFQPPNRIGLGHISRLLAIAMTVRDLRPEIRMPFLVEGHGHGFVEGHGFAEVNVPSGYDLFRTPLWAAWPEEERQAMARDVAKGLVAALRPDLIVFDCFPNLEIGFAAIEHNVPIAVCLRRMKQPDQYFQRYRSVWDAVRLILIPHEEGACDVPPALRSRSRFTGPIARCAPPGVDARRVTADAPLVVISGGGGGYPGTLDFYNLAIEAFARARRLVPGLEGVLVAGPLFGDWWDLRLVDGLRVMPFDLALSRLFVAATVVVCQGGYNTVAELRALGVRCICVPAPRESDDQFERAAQAAAASQVFRMYDGHDAAPLASLLLEALQAPRAEVVSTEPPSGARTSAEHLLTLLP
jgi:UDP-N-acetylglucosamine--N-acetylmuramyl-(pentapeptide) pyrophosphoryl-undecaprenol N-acetylglucosamine transferase